MMERSKQWTWAGANDRLILASVSPSADEVVKHVSVLIINRLIVTYSYGFGTKYDMKSTKSVSFTIECRKISKNVEKNYSSIAGC